MTETFDAICPLCGTDISSETRDTRCPNCGLRIEIIPWTEADYEALLYPVFEALAFNGMVHDEEKEAD